MRFLRFLSLSFMMTQILMSQSIICLVWAKTNDEIQIKILTFLKNRHPQIDKESEFWTSLDSNAPDVIISLIQSNRPVYEKIRLIQSLGWYDDSTAVSFLKDMATNNRNRIFRNAALSAIGTSQGLKESSFISRFLKNEDPSTRVTAAKVMDGFGDNDSSTLVDKSLGKEKNQWVQSKIRHSRSLSEDPNLVKKMKKNF